MNNSNIYAKTRWVAQYGAQMGYNAFDTNDRGWQYTSSGRINGIGGSVDMNAFGNKAYVDKNNSNNATSYEVKGDMDNVVFPVGAYIHDGYLYMSYGGADKVVALCRFSYDELLKELKKNPCK